MKGSTVKLILTLGVITLVFWTGDALLDHYIYHQDGTFWGHLVIDLTPVQVFGRLITIISCGTLGAIAFRFHTVGKRPEDERNRMATIVESSDDAIFSKSIDGLITYWSLGAVKLYGYAREEMMGKHFSLLFAPERRDEAIERFERINHRENARLSESVHIKKDGTLIHVSLNVSIVKAESGRIVGFATIVRDITEEKMMREALETSYMELEQRVDERTRELQVANESLGREVLERTKAEEELRRSAEQLQLLSSRLLTAQESERNRISRELHDELGQALVTLKLRLGHMAKTSQQGGRGLIDECTWAMKFVDQMIEGVRRLSKNLSPTVLDHFGFSAAIRRLAKEFSEHHGVHVLLDLMESDHLFAKDVQVHLYRIFQEALNNIGKYAQATRVTASMRRENGQLSFVVEDDGQGFDLAEVPMRNGSERGLGLAIMRERARMLGGVLDLRSEKGRGTRISVSVPITREEGPDGTLSHRARR